MLSNIILGHSPKKSFQTIHETPTSGREHTQHNLIDINMGRTCSHTRTQSLCASSYDMGSMRPIKKTRQATNKISDDMNYKSQTYGSVERGTGTTKRNKFC